MYGLQLANGVWTLLSMQNLQNYIHIHTAVQIHKLY
jgi:hypothetical protein